MGDRFWPGCQVYDCSGKRFDMSDHTNNPVQHPGKDVDLLHSALPDALESLMVPMAVLKSTGEVRFTNTNFRQRLMAGAALPPSPVFFDTVLRGCFQALPADFRHRLRQPPAFALRVADAAGEAVWQLSVGALCHDQRIVCFSCLSGQRDPQSVLECDTELDPLTGLGNRKRLTRLMDELAPPAEARPRAVMLVNLDHFKRVNESLGHAVGDRLLQLVAARLRRALRPSDPLIRAHADEFIVLLEGEIEASRARGLGERIVDLLSRTFLVNGQQVEIGASIGVALGEAQAPLWADLVRRADLAVLSAKQAGRGCVKLFTPDLEQRAKWHHQITVALRSALVQQEFSVVYQPQLDLAQGNITGFEALLRWTHPELGAIGPDTFIPLAEQLGEIHKLGRWVLRQACREALTWPREITVAVNASPLQIATQDFAQTVASILQQEGLSPHRLEIEITEKMLLKPAAAQQIRALVDLGVGIALDDFGSGYSALSYLNQYRFSKIKLDQSFFRVPPHRVSTSLMKILIGLGQALAVPVVAEGVESRSVCDALKEQGCTAVQGFLISKPVPADSVLPLCRAYAPDSAGAVACEE